MVNYDLIGKYFTFGVPYRYDRSSVIRMEMFTTFKVLKKMKGKKDFRGEPIYEALMDWGEVQRIPEATILSCKEIPKILGVLRMGK